MIAEIGVNHEGDVAVAADLIRKAAACGVDAVKFQTFRIEHYISTEQPERRQRTSRFQLSFDQFRQLADVAKAAGVVFFSTPFSIPDADFLDTVAPLFKISSGDLTFLPLLRHVAAKGKPMIVSTGLGTRDEIAAAVRAILDVSPSAIDDGRLALLHCVAAYPAPAEEANLRNILWLRDEFGVPVGYSDHTLGIKACELAVALGAVILEKHFTYRKEGQAFHDHALSADPTDMAELVRHVRQAETYLGSRERHRTPTETKGLANMRRSIGALTDIPAGKPIKAEWLTYLRPAWGLPVDSFDRLVGRRLKRPVAAGAVVRAEDVET